MNQYDTNVDNTPYKDSESPGEESQRASETHNEVIEQQHPLKTSKTMKEKSMSPERQEQITMLNKQRTMVTKTSSEPTQHK